jgi:UDP-GlcNAc:undecaprenyl-phosphate GlcNAc-1-phosphate transferase
MMPQYTMHLANAFLLVVVLIPLLNRVAERIGLVDLPKGRKIHVGAIPVTGGLAMFAGFIFPVMNLGGPAEVYFGFLLGLSLLVVIGAIDDLVGLGPWPKLAGQTLAALAMTLPGPHLIGIDDVIEGAGFQLPQMDLALTIVFIVGLINALNMIDGLDGLAGGAAASALFWLAIIAGCSGRKGPLIIVLLLLSALMGFMLFNVRHPWRRQALVFMGDSGSMMLGAAIAFFTIDLSGGPMKAASLPSLLWLLALPVFDTLSLIGRRLALGRSPLSGDRRHLHHILLQAGVSPPAAAVALTSVCLLLGAVGVSGWLGGLPNHLMLIGLIVPFAVHAFFVLYGWQLVGRTGDSPSNAAIAATNAGE